MRYKKTAKTDVSSSSVDITANVAVTSEHEVYEVQAQGGGMWVNHQGGTASAAGADCIYLADGESVLITIDSGVTKLTAIRAVGDMDAIVSLLQPV